MEWGQSAWIAESQKRIEGFGNRRPILDFTAQCLIHYKILSTTPNSGRYFD